MTNMQTNMPDHHMMHHYMLTVQFTGNLQQLWLYKVMMHNVLVGHHLQLIMLFTGVKVVLA